jgi:hypothetical protein
VHFTQGGNGGNQQSVVGQRGKKLRRHNDVEAEWHVGACLVLIVGEFIPWICVGKESSNFVKPRAL